MTKYTRKQISEAIAHWTAVLEGMDGEQAAGLWQVDWTDSEDSGTASFKSREEASEWIKAREEQERYEPTGFEAEPPKKASSQATGLWDEHGDGPVQDAASFKKAACSLLKTGEWDFYEQFVPEKYEDFQGDRTAIDDWDMWKVNH